MIKNHYLSENIYKYFIKILNALTLKTQWIKGIKNLINKTNKRTKNRKHEWR